MAGARRRGEMQQTAAAAQMREERGRRLGYSRAMSSRRHAPLFVFAAIAAFVGAAWLARQRPPWRNRRVPQPQQPVELDRYLGLWYELGRYENSFERGCDCVTAEYRRRPAGLIEIVNRARGRNGAERVAVGRAKVRPGTGGAKLKVSFFGPFYVGDYWVLDHADDYSWSIVGEPSGRFLWLLSRDAHPWGKVLEALEDRAVELGYRRELIRRTYQGAAPAKGKRRAPEPAAAGADLEDDYESAE